MLREEKFPQGTIRIPCEINFTESCGCPAKEKREHNETISDLFTRLEKEREFRHDINGMIVAINDECVVDTFLDYSGKKEIFDKMLKEKYFTSKELQYDNEVRIFMTPYDYHEFLSYKDNLIKKGDNLINRLNLKSFNDKDNDCCIGARLS